MQMKAVRIHEYGDTDILRYEDVDSPEPTADEVRVQVRAASVNPIDWKTRQGAGIPVEFPWIVGWDVAGVVDEIGANVSDLEVGDEAYGLVHFSGGGGAYAEAITAPAAELMTKPDRLSFEEAAGVPMVSLTAWQALEATDVGEGTRVLVHAAAGGVGHFAVQFAKQRNAHVIGTASGSNEEYLRELGVDEFVNYREQRFEEVIEPVDAMIDGIGGETFDRSLEILNGDGVIDKLPSDLTPEQQEKADEHGVQAIHTNVRWNREWFNEITALIEEGAVTPTVETVLPLSETQRAHELSEDGHVRGKLVLTPDE
jgi:NADPH:quinone reductase-like Zn-dependent oxidoreductase